MANWEYKVISSGKHGMASMAALEQHLNDLGQQQWEIITWHTAPDNPLLFSGLARRPIMRDWKPEEMPAAQEAARLEKIEGAKEREAWRETLKEELEFLADVEEVSDPEADAEDLLDLLRQHMKRSQRGVGLVGSVSFLARKLEQDDNDLLGALGELGLALAEDPQATPASIQHEDESFWLSKNPRGEVWLHCGPKAPAPKPKPEPRPERPERPAAKPRPEKRVQEVAAEVAREAMEPKEETAPAEEPSASAPARREPAAPRGSVPPLPEGEPLLAKLRPMMRRNRRGRGWSGSTSYLSKALRHSEEELMAAFAKLGLVLTEDPQAKPVFVELNGFLYWVNRGQGGQIWINAREQRHGEPAHASGDENDSGAEAGAPAPGPSGPVGGPETASVDGEEPEPENSGREQISPSAEEQVGPDDSVFARIRPHFTKNKRGTSFSAAPGGVADALGVSQADLIDALVKAGMEVPESEASKPVFAEHADEIFWFNRNAKDELWLNAKAKPARRPATRAKAKAPSRAKPKADAEPETA